MQWIESAVPCEGDPEQLCYALAELGVEGMSIEDEKDFQEFLENNRAYWDYVDEELEQRFAWLSRVKFWLSCDEAGRSVLDRVRAANLCMEAQKLYYSGRRTLALRMISSAVLLDPASDPVRRQYYRMTGRFPVLGLHGVRR